MLNAKCHENRIPIQFHFSLRYNTRTSVLYCSMIWMKQFMTPVPDRWAPFIIPFHFFPCCLVCIPKPRLRHALLYLRYQHIKCKFIAIIKSFYVRKLASSLAGLIFFSFSITFFIVELFSQYIFFWIASDARMECAQWQLELSFSAKNIFSFRCFMRASAFQVWWISIYASG